MDAFLHELDKLPKPMALVNERKQRKRVKKAVKHDDDSNLDERLLKLNVSTLGATSAEVKVMASKALRLDKIKALLKEQSLALEKYKRLEDEIVQLITGRKGHDEGDEALPSTVSKT
jgi:hypothetical protein